MFSSNCSHQNVLKLFPSDVLLKTLLKMFSECSPQNVLFKLFSSECSPQNVLSNLFSSECSQNVLLKMFLSNCSPQNVLLEMFPSTLLIWKHWKIPRVYIEYPYPGHIKLTFLTNVQPYLPSPCKPHRNSLISCRFLTVIRRFLT